MSSYTAYTEFEDQLIGQSMQVIDLTSFVSLPAEVFQRNENRRIHEAVCSINGKGEVVDFISVFEYLSEKYSDHESLDSLQKRCESWVATGWFPKLCDRVLKAYNHKHLLDSVADSIREAEMAADAEEAKQTIIGRILALDDTSADRYLWSGRDCLKQVIEICRDNFSKTPEEKDASRGITTGFKTLDCYLRWRAGGVYLLGAVTGGGKSVMGLNFARAAARDGKKVLYVSLEMYAVDLMRRIVAAESSINPRLIESGNLTEEQINSLLASNAIVAEYMDNIQIYDQAGITVFRLAALIRQAKLISDIDLVIIDYLQLLNTKKGHSRESEVSEISGAIKTMAKANEIPIIALTQLNKDGGVRESSKVEMDATAFMKIDHDGGRPEPGTHDIDCRLVLGKSRHDGTGVIPMCFQRSYSRFID